MAWYYAKYAAQYSARWSREKEKGFRLMRASSPEEALEKFSSYFRDWVDVVKGYQGWKYVAVNYRVFPLRKTEETLWVSGTEYVINENHEAY